MMFRRLKRALPRTTDRLVGPAPQYRSPLQGSNIEHGVATWRSQSLGAPRASGRLEVGFDARAVVSKLTSWPSVVAIRDAAAQMLLM